MPNVASHNYWNFGFYSHLQERLIIRSLKRGIQLWFELPEFCGGTERVQNIVYILQRKPCFWRGPLCHLLVLEEQMIAQDDLPVASAKLSKDIKRSTALDQSELTKTLVSMIARNGTGRFLLLRESLGQLHDWFLFRKRER